MAKKKIVVVAIAIVLVVALLLAAFAGCSNEAEAFSADPEISASVPLESEIPSDALESGVPVVASEPVTNGDGQEDPNPVDTGGSSSGDSSGSGSASGTGNSSNSGNSGSGSSGSGSSGSGSSGSGSSGSGSSGSGSSGTGSSGSGGSGSGGSGSGGSGSGSSPAPTPTPKPSATPSPTPTPKPGTNPSPSPAPTPTAPGPSPTPGHTHNWEDIIEIVYHEEVGHYEWQEWDEPVYETKAICNGCGAYFDTVLEVNDHIMVVHNGGASYTVKRVQTGTIHHSEEVWVVDEAAWEQQVVVGRKCTICGEFFMY